MVIKAKMPNDAWLSTITGLPPSKYRGHSQLRGPFTADYRAPSAAVSPRRRRWGDMPGETGAFCGAVGTSLHGSSKEKEQKRREEKRREEKRRGKK